MVVNYFGTLYAMRAAVPRMAEGGQVVLIASAAGLAETLRGELKPLGVSVSAVHPPDTDTPQLREENLTKPPETRRITKSASVGSADAVARRIADGVERGAFVISPGAEATVLVRLGSLLAPVLNRYCDWVAAWARDEGAEPAPVAPLRAPGG
jgi:3-dehydrosphinganine reductase